MARGISLHIGVNVVDHNHYVDLSDLDFCEADAEVMQKIAEAQNFETQVLLGKAATRDNVAEAIESAAEQLDKGDIFLLTYAGHGCYIPDLNKDERKVKGRMLDRRDETWCLYDAQQVDDERGMLWSRFADGVRICVLSDSCHSGTTARGAGDDKPPPTPRFKKRAASRSAAEKTYEAHKAFYDSLQCDAPTKIGADLMLISGCQDEEEAGEDADLGHGLFTYALNEFWSKGEFDGTYKDLWKAIKGQMPGDQTPNMGPKNPPPKFAKQRPFTI